MKPWILAAAMMLGSELPCLAADGKLLGGRQSRHQQMRYRDQQSGDYPTAAMAHLVRPGGPYKSRADAKPARSIIQWLLAGLPADG